MAQNEKVLRVKGKDFVCGAVIAKNEQGNWFVLEIVPHLEKIVKGIPIADWGKKFDEIGATYEWVTDESLV